MALHALSAPDGTTGFIDLMMASSGDDVVVLPFSWRTALFGHYDVLHVHWPEFLMRGSTPTRTALKRVGTAALASRIALTRTPVFRTVHNIAPHEGVRTLERFLVATLASLTRANIVLNSATPVDGSLPTFVIPHNHYRDFPNFSPVDGQGNGVLLYFGLIRDYKGLDDLTSAFDGLTRRDASLRIVGKPKSVDVVARVSAFAESRSNVTTKFGYLSDEDLAAEVRQSSVVVLPYRAMHNSGALLLALSMARTVVAPRSPSTELIRDEVGAEWLHLYEGPSVTPGDLSDALDASVARAAGARPRFVGRDLADVGAGHSAAYRRVLGGHDSKDRTMLHYLVGGVRISLGSPSNTPGPRTHILNFLRAAGERNIGTRLFLASEFPLLGRFSRVEQTQYQNIGSARTVTVDVVRCVIMVWSGLVMLALSCIRERPAVIYERLSVFQSLTSFHRYKRSAVRVVEANGILSRETSRDRNISKAEWLTRAIERHVLRRADVVVAVSDSLASELVDFARLDRSRILVVPNGLDSSLLTVPRTTATHFTFGFVGSVVAWHDLNTVVASICKHLCEKKVLVDGRPVAVEIIGDGPALADLRGLVETAGWTEFVSFAGRLPQVDAIKRMAGWDVGIAGHRASSSSTMYHSPLKLYEYAGLGLEIVCTPSADARALQSSGAAVHLYRTEQDLVAILKHPEGFGRSPRDIQASRQSVADDHTWERRVDAVVDAAEAVRA
ncbi:MULTISPECIES: glycosyltransferase [unclassified Rhodococcus (in: high G+C Gram-positive bacteria)]|uniref:glycosyltransferase n=2 Tax=unclassified Rhodococcus (in: high G+C Gram-positive bacteria) TaxID=192944 RepID=UPI001C9AFABC|nr:MULTISPECIES: glycosyltransferase [unclassified Rhodococcus (in: high G+C Gram-positive bacteria)]MBY6685416.1 glycosyltransferase [Rhodococcus sp. BP-288]MBY6696243.1 glycosyltransferase [Rhodococcus sp. BP-188]MBY6696882.1 glycosyltransferase [Rhodococcus sp. BP-285]MBY6703538.1 glycosyltransferase [Rhodococcus sp. BP-283]MBY6710508.1 glycosyltransferase [Rhodococcus sp. BP-160]